MANTENFYGEVPIFSGFPRLMDDTLYRQLPQDWFVFSADVVASTRAIAENRYKAVNMAGAAVIAAASNALKGEFPFVFGGDGASFAVPPQWADAARQSLAATLSWTREELALELRGAMIPMEAVREHGFDIRIARFAPSQNVAYAMFTGGGLAWAETVMKQGRYAVTAAQDGSLPDLTGLSCRFEEMPAMHGLILALLVMPAEQARAKEFRRFVDDLVQLVEENGHAPVPAGAPAFVWPPQGVELEAHVGRRPGQSLALRRAGVLMRTLLYFLVLRLRLRVGDFVPDRYLKQVVENSDFRKYDDALRMIVDCSPEVADEIERRCAQAASEGIVSFGTHRQKSAMMTCFTPQPSRADHVHFVDGASGGYALAALALKNSLQAR